MTTVPVQRRRVGRRAIPYVLLAVLTVAAGVVAWYSSRSNNATIGPEGVLIYRVPDLAPRSTTLTGQPVDGITCRTVAKEVVKYHIHVHIAIYVNGAMERLPAGIGITEPAVVSKYSTGEFYDVGLYDCLYWIHTHAADGIVHVEAPVKGLYTLGQFFDIWHQPLTTDQVGPALGKVVVFENGKRLSGDPRLTALLPHGVIQIDVGTPTVAFQPVTFKVSGGCGEGTTSCSR
ncbi:MAG: hypothetical protein HKL86_06640 [Acidimicrobiaceae bacterium]|nr:hypothetical protein [Acidimicrobiaceae bacterium]